MALVLRGTDACLFTGSDAAARSGLIELDIMVTMYGTFVRAARESRSLTQRQLAEISGVRQSNISAIESGRRLPSADTLNRLIVGCGYELSATAGNRTIFCPLPQAGWFPDDDLPPIAEDDPPDERPALGPDASMEERVRTITAVLDAADATRRS